MLLMGMVLEPRARLCNLNLHPATPHRYRPLFHFQRRNVRSWPNSVIASDMSWALGLWPPRPSLRPNSLSGPLGLKRIVPAQRFDPDRDLGCAAVDQQGNQDQKHRRGVHRDMLAVRAIRNESTRLGRLNHELP